MFDSDRLRFICSFWLLSLDFFFPPLEPPEQCKISSFPKRNCHSVSRWSLRTAGGDATFRCEPYSVWLAATYFPTTFMLSVSFSPVPERVIAEPVFSDPLWHQERGNYYHYRHYCCALPLHSYLIGARFLKTDYPYQMIQSGSAAIGNATNNTRR